MVKIKYTLPSIPPVGHKMPRKSVFIKLIVFDIIPAISDRLVSESVVSVAHSTSITECTERTSVSALCAATSTLSRGEILRLSRSVSHTSV